MSLTLNNGPNAAYAHETVGTLTSAIGGTVATYDTKSEHGSQIEVLHPNEALITVETADIRWTCDGTTPTTTATTAVGHLTAFGDSIALIGYHNIKNFKAINAVGSSGSTLRITYYR